MSDHAQYHDPAEEHEHQPDGIPFPVSENISRELTSESGRQRFEEDRLLRMVDSPTVADKANVRGAGGGSWPPFDPNEQEHPSQYRQPEYYASLYDDRGGWSSTIRPPGAKGGISSPLEQQLYHDQHCDLSAITEKSGVSSGPGLLLPPEPEDLKQHPSRSSAGDSSSTNGMGGGLSSPGETADPLDSGHSSARGGYNPHEQYHPPVPAPPPPRVGPPTNSKGTTAAAALQQQHRLPHSARNDPAGPPPPAQQQQHPPRGPPPLTTTGTTTPPTPSSLTIAAATVLVETLVHWEGNRLAYWEGDHKTWLKL